MQWGIASNRRWCVFPAFVALITAASVLPAVAVSPAAAVTSARETPQIRLLSSDVASAGSSVSLLRAAPVPVVRHFAVPVALSISQRVGRDDVITAGAAVAFPPVVALADKLRTPQRIFSWVRRNVISVPLRGATQGAAGCYETLQCSADDTALLLAALLGARGVQVRFVQGTVELTVPQFESAMGAFTSLTAAVKMAASGGIPVAETGGRPGHPTGVEVGTVWVEALVSSVTGQQARWIALDAYLKPLRFIAPVNVASAAGVSQAAITKLAASATTDPSLPAVTSINGQAVSSAVSGWYAKIAGRERAMARQGKTVGDFLGGLVAAVPAASPLAGPEGTIVKIDSVTAALPAGDYDVATVTVGPDISLNIEMALLSVQRLTVGYVPATAADAAVIKSFGGLYKTEPFAVSLRPVVYLGGSPLAVGEPVQFGYEELLTYTYTEPDRAAIPVSTHYLPVGGYAAFGVATGPVIGRELGEDLPAWQSTISALAAGHTVEMDDVLGEILSIHAREYYAMMDAADEAIGNQLDTRMVARPREMFMSYFPAFAFSGPEPSAVTGSGMNMDLQDVSLSVGSAAGSVPDQGAALTSAGMMSSELEGVIFRAAEQTPAVSTVSLLAAGVTGGATPIAVLGPSDASVTSAALELPAAYQQAIQAAAASGYLVLATSKEVTSGGWSGAAWADISPQGYGYEIGGGLSGGSTTEQTPQMNLWQTAADSTLPLVPDADQVTGTAAKDIASGLGYLGDGLNGYEAYQTETEVMDQTGDPLKAIEAGETSLAIGEVTGTAISVGSIPLIAMLGLIVTADVVSVPLLLTIGAIGLVSAFAINFIGNIWTTMIVNAIKRSG
jgi:Transglutaminase-like superfamily